jgi:organic radical activating enzyme
MRKFLFDIDIGGACNLRCPSCPQGNVKDYRLSHGFMEPELLARIVEKAKSECRVGPVSLYNWAEPLLHPRLPELIRIVQDAGIPCHLSSNLNILPNADAIMAANPASFRISTSGFSQEIYGRTHRGGNIERVKKHMVELVQAKKRNKATTDIYVYYHRYRHNLKEGSLMREFAAGISIKFVPDWALMLPLEKIIGYVEGDDFDLPLTVEDQTLIGSLALPLRAALVASRKYGNRPCPMREEAITLDFQGNVMLCCGVFDARKYTLGFYIDMPLAEIQRLKQNHPMCGRCMRHGAHVYLTYGIDEMDELALAEIAPEDAELLDLSYELAWKRRQQRLTKLYDRFFAGFFSTGQKAALAGLFFRMQRFSRRIRREKFGNGERS